MEQRGIISKQDHGHSIIYHMKNSIVEIHCSDNFTYEIEDIKENIDYLKTIGNDLLILNCVAPYTQISTEARAFLAKGPHLGIVKVEAFWIQSLAQKLLASFFVKIDKPKVPVKFLLDKNEAEKWLLNFK